MSNGNEMAFPFFFPADAGSIHTGLTKREYFAVHLMAALKSQYCTETNDDNYSHENAARAAVRCADALLQELSK